MMRARLRFENQLFHQLEDDGWRCLRSAGSRGPFDIIAFSQTAIRLIQVKTTNNLTGRHVEPMIRKAVQLLSKLHIPANTERWVYLKVLRGDWLSERVDGYTREDIAKLVHRWRDRERLPDVKELVR